MKKRCAGCLFLLRRRGPDFELRGQLFNDAYSMLYLWGKRKGKGLKINK
jgi:hypothetical protein